MLFIVGITDNAQDQLGDSVFVGEVEVGNKVAAGDVVAVVESVKAASDIYAPVSGEIIEFNEALDAEPNLINENAHEHWIFKMKVDNPDDIEDLLDAAAYLAEQK